MGTDGNGGESGTVSRSPAESGYRPRCPWDKTDSPAPRSSNRAKWRPTTDLPFPSLANLPMAAFVGANTSYEAFCFHFSQVIFHAIFSNSADSLRNLITTRLGVGSEGL